MTKYEIHKTSNQRFLYSPNHRITGRHSANQLASQLTNHVLSHQPPALPSLICSEVCKCASWPRANHSGLVALGDGVQSVSAIEEAGRSISGLAPTTDWIDFQVPFANRHPTAAIGAVIASTTYSSLFLCSRPALILPIHAKKKMAQSSPT